MTHEAKARRCRYCGAEPQLIHSHAANDYKIMCRNPECPQKPRTDWRETKSRAMYDWNRGLYMKGAIPVLGPMPAAVLPHNQK